MARPQHSPTDESQTGELQDVVRELETTLDAIRSGGVDAVIVGKPGEERIYALTSADRPYRVIVDEMGEGAATVSAGGTVLYANRQLAHLLELSREDVLGTDVLKYVSDGDRGELRRLLAVAPGVTYRRELTLVGKGDARIPALVSVTGIEIDGVSLHCLVAADLSEQRAAEFRLSAALTDLELRAVQLEDANVHLARSSAQFSAAFEFAPVGMALVSLDRVLLRTNETFDTLLGRTPQDLAGSRIDAFIEGEGPDHELFAALVSGRIHNYQCEVPLMVGEGQVRWATFSVARVSEKNGEDYAAFHVEDITDRRGYEARLKHLADHDPLTGLMNRRMFHDELQKFLARLEPGQNQGVLALLDLDGFKYVNDTLGHPVGDTLLQSVSKAVQRSLRSTDLCARLGGDEFAVLMFDATPEQARKALEGLRLAVKEVEGEATGRRVRTSVSIGMVEATRDTSADDLIANADLAMYAAKDLGRDRVVAFDPDNPAVGRSAANYFWGDRIREALENDLFVLVAQPILDLHTNAINGCELLLRMRDGLGLVPPGDFLPIAERRGYSSEIDAKVLRLGLELAGKFRQAAPFRWEINLSGSALTDTTLPRLIEQLLIEHDVEPSNIVFEITETVAITNMAQAQELATQIRRLGCGFALDDFGSGYGGFRYLKFLPMDFIKIDGEFIRDLPSDQTNQIIVQAIVAAARPLGKKTIAEYVGDEGTVDLLRQFGVDFAQGYHVGVPADPATLFPTLRAEPEESSSIPD